MSKNFGDLGLGSIIKYQNEQWTNLWIKIEREKYKIIHTTHPEWKPAFILWHIAESRIINTETNITVLYDTNINEI